MQWEEVQTKDPIYLNLGGGKCCHPASGYENYISVDRNPRGGWAVAHDLRQPIPLPDGTVDRILTEDFIEHMSLEAIDALLLECYRLLKPGGMMRIGVPDYGNPKNRQHLEDGVDPFMPGHITLTHYALMREIAERAPFSHHEFYQYWDGERFIWGPVDYSLGLIQRTPENYYRLYMRGLRQKYHHLLYTWRSRSTRAAQASGDSAGDIIYGHPLYATEVVLDLYKDG